MENPTPPQETVKKPRRFAPEPVETSTRSSKEEKKKSKAQDESPAHDGGADPVSPPKKRFLPTPVETSFKSSKRPAHSSFNAGSTPLSKAPMLPNEFTPARQRFTPQLIETTKRSKKAGDARPATLPTDKTDLTPGVPNIYTARPKRSRISPDDAAAGSGLHHVPSHAPRHQGSMRPHFNSPRRTTRSDSFQPELDSIVSSRENSEEDNDSDGGSPPSLSDSVESAQDSLNRIQLARTRESCDDRFSGYLLALAAKAAEKQLQEQADLLAAFPNETAHEIVEHFYGGDTSDDDDDDSVEGVGMLVDDADTPRPASVEQKPSEQQGGWEMKEMEGHQDALAKLRAAAHERLALMKEVENNKKMAAEAAKKDPWAGQVDKNSPFYNTDAADDATREAELKAMRSAASPPMLGGDILFRRCPSPKATKFESDQRVDIQPNRSISGGGLWGGYCVAEEAGEYLSPVVMKGPNLIHTPSIERDDPFASAFSSKVPSGVKTPKPNDSGVRMLAGIDDRLKSEIARSKRQDALLLEFDDEFVSQVYNYLSLGYPTLARPFDQELAKISQIPEIELRKDDSKQDAKGYISIKDPKFATSNPLSPNKKSSDHMNHCIRWKALRIYILEWARQHPSLSNGVGTPSWGVRARRGSWAI